MQNEKRKKTRLNLMWNWNLMHATPHPEKSIKREKKFEKTVVYCVHPLLRSEMTDIQTNE